MLNSKGVIVDTTTDANETAKQLCIDLQNKSTYQIKETKPGSKKIVNLLRDRQIRYVDKFGWKKIDEEEISRGKLVGKPRDKITKIEEMLKVAFSE